MKKSRASLLASLFTAVLTIFSGCSRENSVTPSSSQGVVLKKEAKQDPQEELAKKVRSAPSKTMNQPGLVGALGGSHVKLLKSGIHEILFPLPQLTDGQVPVCFYVSSTPRDAMIEYHLRKRNDSNVIVSIRLKGERNQEVQIDWCSVIMVARKAVSQNKTIPNQYLSATACVQSQAKEITKIAKDLWPKNGKLTDYATNIQRFVREMKTVKRPRSLDALGILESGTNGICTANANLALALLRSKGIASRSMGVIPPISQRLEMHRVVEYFHEGDWRAFDPSSLHADVPMKPWQYIIMAKTTIADENKAMKPRMSAMAGCPYAQELELISDGITLWGRDFFWTIAKPLAEFEIPEDAIALATAAWNRYLQAGTLSQGQMKAASAKNGREFLESLQTK